MILYRCFPYSPTAKKNEPGHPLFIPMNRATGRINNPDIYSSSYWSAQAECAVAETYGGLMEWSPATFIGTPQLKDSNQALVSVEIPDAMEILDLDVARNLVKLKLRPSRVVTRDNSVTQAWAREIFKEKKYAGVAWWSIWWPEWQSLGLWNLRTTKVMKVEKLNINHDAVVLAADVLNKRVAKS